MVNVWELRPRIPTVRSMTSIPVAGYNYAMGSKSKSINSARSETSSPPPEYDTRADTVDNSTRTRNPVAVDRGSISLSSAPSPEDLEQALLFQRQRIEASDRARYISQGAVMLRTSQDSVQGAQNTEDLKFAREIYFTSIDYLLRGVPTDLSAEEREHLSRTIDSFCSRIALQRVEPLETEEVDVDGTQQLFVKFCRGTATLIKISIPRVRQGLESAIELERRYHLLERSGMAVSTSLFVIANRASKTSIKVPDVSRFGGLATSICNGLVVGLAEGYKVLA